ncbi:MAG: hypothetical protein Edafosvirus8_20 [Edafosvirus sp.]|uniref:Uncharacterized protein n=1 Tax=Edafosvirus sp. TaxID=2487765 RepID=A0A3G4ZTP6_9VIRU|nr:MAG: hypothetical protein Edafosvirus8_20 [Edafosvirus sp.]
MTELNNLMEKVDNLITQSKKIKETIQDLSIEMYKLQQKDEGKYIIEKIYKMTEADLSLNITKAWICGGPCDGTDEWNERFPDYMVKFGYILNNIVYRVYISDNLIRINNEDLNKNNIHHQPAYLLYQKLLKGQASNYDYLSHIYFQIVDKNEMIYCYGIPF